MLDDKEPAVQEIIRRARALGITGNPDRAVHSLGKVKLLSGEEVSAYMLHAADPVITDGESVVLIDRDHEPGKGKPALPGGLIDPLRDGTAESALHAAKRETKEETGIILSKAVLKGPGILVGTRNMNRPKDVRSVYADWPKYGLSKGDVILVSTQAVRFDVPHLKNIKLKAGDDAIPGSARLVKIRDLKKEDLGIADHYDMIMEAMSLTASKPSKGDRWVDGNPSKPAAAFR